MIWNKCRELEPSPLNVFQFIPLADDKIIITYLGSYQSDQFIFTPNHYPSIQPNQFLEIRTLHPNPLGLSSILGSYKVIDNIQYIPSRKVWMKIVGVLKGKCASGLADETELAV